MKLSFLYPDGITTKSALNANEPNLGRIGPRTLYHLSLDRTFAEICDDDVPRSVFLKVLSIPSTDPAVITYRQQLLAALAASPDFFAELQNLYGRFKGLWDSHDRERQAMMRHIHNSTAGASAQTLKSLLQANALTLKRCLAFLRGISDLFDEFRVGGEDCRSTALKRLAREVGEISKSAAFDKLNALCSRFEDMGIDAIYDFHATLGETGQIEICRMIDHKYLHITDPDFQPRRRWFSRRVEEETTSDCVRIHMIEDTTYDKLMSVPLQLLAEQIDTLSDQLFEHFCHIADELAFYDVALRYLRICREKGIRVTYPSVAHDQDYDISSLRDLALITDENQKDPVIPNNISGETVRGMIVFGENNSGKTVFLRSLGTAQLLAQAGLPIPADGAKMPVCSQIMTQFSEAEKEFERGNDAGRFEQEVRELASVIDDLDDGALILLNETFQTTAYEEGAEGLYHILNYFSARKIRFLLVSHLHQLEGRFDGREVGIYRTQPGYKVCAER
ncbi:MAG: hypothetical protein E7604_12090 [Ruminococcaceae bacterium]|nr:hypothetical protein [Oscillospiraceae bacterium]